MSVHQDLGSYGIKVADRHIQDGATISHVDNGGLFFEALDSGENLSKSR